MRNLQITPLNSFSEKENEIIALFLAKLGEKLNYPIFTQNKKGNASYGEFGSGFFVIFFSMFRCSWFRFTKDLGEILVEVEANTESLVHSWHSVGFLSNQLAFDQTVEKTINHCAYHYNAKLKKHTFEQGILNEVIQDRSDDLFDLYQSSQRLDNISISADLIVKSLAEKIKEMLGISVRLANKRDTSPYDTHGEAYLYLDKNNSESDCFQIKEFKPYHLHLMQKSPISVNFGTIINAHTLDVVANGICQKQQKTN